MTLLLIFQGPPVVTPPVPLAFETVMQISPNGYLRMVLRAVT